jgi:hypothetical protein
MVAISFEKERRPFREGLSLGEGERIELNRLPAMNEDQCIANPSSVACPRGDQIRQAFARHLLASQLVAQKFEQRNFEKQQCWHQFAEEADLVCIR